VNNTILFEVPPLNAQDEYAVNAKNLGGYRPVAPRGYAYD